MTDLTKSVPAEWAMKVVDGYGLADDKLTNETRRLKIARAIEAADKAATERAALALAFAAIALAAAAEWVASAAVGG